MPKPKKRGKKRLTGAVGVADRVFGVSMDPRERARRRKRQRKAVREGDVMTVAFGRKGGGFWR